jgi:hypothetical protein
MDKDNAPAILAFSQLTTAYAFASPYPPGSILFAGLCSSTGVPEWVTLLRGARGIMAMSKDWIDAGPLAWQAQDLIDPVDLSLSPDDHHLAALGQEMERLPVSSPEEIDEMDIYRETLALLRRSFALPWQPGAPLGVKFSVFIWVESVPQEYLELLSVLRPIALVMLCSMCVLLQQCGHFWYIKGAAERIIKEVYSVLGEEWKPWIAWPLQRILNQAEI